MTSPLRSCPQNVLQWQLRLWAALCQLCRDIMMHFPSSLLVLCRRQLTVAGVRKWLIVDEQGDANIVEVSHCFQNCFASTPYGIKASSAPEKSGKRQMKGALQARQTGDLQSGSHLHPS